MAGCDMFTFREFLEFANGTPAEVARPRQYLNTHAERFYETYRRLVRYVGDDSRILSVGAGRAFVECALSANHNTSITVFDFGEAVERNADQYARYGFKTNAGDFTKTSIEAEQESFDAILYCEILEHIPIAPAEQFNLLMRYLRPGGYLIVTTPNIASAISVAKLIRGRNVLPDARRLFSDVAPENESVHRREYVLPELTEAMHEVGMAVVESSYINSGRAKWRPGSLVLRACTDLIPRFRPKLLVIGRKQFV